MKPSPNQPTDEPDGGGSVAPSRSPWRFIALTFLLSIPFLVLGGTTKVDLLPRLPVTALMAVCPMIAAWILIRREGGAGAVKRWLRDVFDVRRSRPGIWIAPTLLLMPLVMVASFAWLRLEGVPVPLPVASLRTAVLLFLAFLVFALAEELGWSGYAIDPMQRQFGALRAALTLGAVWAAFHFVALAQAGRSMGWIAWWSLGTVASRVVIVWLYNNTARSVLIAALFHATENLTWQLFPVQGSYYDPRVTGLIMLVVAMTVVYLWGPRTLAGRESRRVQVTV